MTADNDPRERSHDTLALTLGHDQLVIRRRYETLSILNDFLVALWFLVGSVLFLYPSLERLAVWMFILGSAQFMARPTIRLLHRIHLRRFPASRWEM